MSNYQSPGDGARVDGSACPTKKVEVKDFYDRWNDEWVMKEETIPICKTEDISTGRYRCTVCGDVGNYEGSGGIPAENISPERLECLVDKDYLKKREFREQNEN